MDQSKIIVSQRMNTDFVIGSDQFGDLQISPAPEHENFYYFFNKKDRRLIKQFILIKKPHIWRVCTVTLIKKGDKFTPRIAFSVRNEKGQIATSFATDDAELHEMKARVDLEDCHENLWELLSFLQSLREIEIPQRPFSLVSQDESQIVSALRERGTSSMASIIKQLASTPSFSLSKDDLNQLLKRREKLSVFEKQLSICSDENWWQEFFERNKWIFGYGLDYQILRHEQAQPNYGGMRVDGRGGQKGDYLTSTEGDINFTVLVEIKTPGTPLLHGNQEIRSGAWSLSKDLTDSLSQIEANISTWDKQGSDEPDNRDRFERAGVYTVEPKGIVVIGSLGELKDIRSKRETFQRFRKSIHGVDILTFDELYNRARFIVEGRVTHPVA